jgi:hypothetical protein
LLARVPYCTTNINNDLTTYNFIRHSGISQEVFYGIFGQIGEVFSGILSGIRKNFHQIVEKRGIFLILLGCKLFCVFFFRCFREWFFEIRNRGLS